MGRLSRLILKTPQTIPTLSERTLYGGGISVIPNRARGIDVSNHNPNFPWHEWDGHIQFASIKATEGLSFLDPWFGYNWKGAASIGAFRFAYHYAHPNLNPVEQAKFLVNYVRQHGLGQHDNFVLDLEYPDGKFTPEQAWGMTPSQVSFWAWVFCTTINRLTPNRILPYVNPSFAEDGNCAKLGGWGLWIANYGVAEPTVPPPWRFWRFWQYTGSPLDLDFYNGDEMALAQFCAR